MPESDRSVERQARTGTLGTELTQPHASNCAYLGVDLELGFYKEDVWKPWLKRERECSYVSIRTCPQSTAI